MHCVPKHAAGQVDLIIVVIADATVALWLDEIRQTLLQMIVCRSIVFYSVYIIQNRGKLIDVDYYQLWALTKQ